MMASSLSITVLKGVSFGIRPASNEGPVVLVRISDDITLFAYFETVSIARTTSRSENPEAKAAASTDQ